jgi:hypothetical protein
VYAISLLEFLLHPDADQYVPFCEVKKVIARYNATDRRHYVALQERMFQLTGKKKEAGGGIGYRTRIVHLGQRLEEILRDSNELFGVLRELQGHAGCVIDHMIDHSEMRLEDYLAIRQRMNPFFDEPLL